MNGTVYIVDDDAAVRESLALLMRSVGITAKSFDAATEFLDELPNLNTHGDHASCLLLDVRMPKMSGLDLQRALEEKGVRIPIIFITGHGDIPMAVQAMKVGAVDFLSKPLRDQDVIESVQRALDVSDQRREDEVAKEAFAEKLSTLTPREHEVMLLVVEGLPNKAIAADLNISERTVEVHRAKIMHKLEAESLAHLVRLNLQGQ